LTSPITVNTAVRLFSEMPGRYAGMVFEVM
jgi:hypothetical protein